MSRSISIVTVNLNGAAHLDSLLRSIRDQTVQAVETIVVDNGSTDDSERVVREFGVTWLPTGRNIGLAPGLQLGAELASGDDLLFLNNDVQFDRDFLEVMQAAQRRNPGAFAIDAVQYDLAGELVHSVVRFRRAPFHIRSDIPGWRMQVADEIGLSPAATAVGSAANLLIARDDFFTLGGWDTAFFLGHEDLDLCWRLWAAGEAVSLDPGAKCIHDVGATSRTAEGRRARVYGTISGRLRFATKHLPVEKLVCVVVVALLSLPASLLRGDVAPRARALRDFFQTLPTTLAWRRRFYASVGVSPRTHLRFMTSRF